MTSNEFSIWLKGFTDALGENITPIQLEILKSKINEVNFQPYNPDIIFPSYPWGPQNPFYTECTSVTTNDGTTTFKTFYKTTNK